MAPLAGLDVSPPGHGRPAGVHAAALHPHALLALAPAPEWEAVALVRASPARGRGALRVETARQLDGAAGLGGNVRRLWFGVDDFVVAGFPVVPHGLFGGRAVGPRKGGR